MDRGSITSLVVYYIVYMGIVCGANLRLLCAVIGPGRPDFCACVHVMITYECGGGGYVGLLWVGAKRDDATAHDDATN